MARAVVNQFSIGEKTKKTQLFERKLVYILEKRLNNLENQVNSGNNISNKVYLCKEAEEIAYLEQIDIKEYINRRKNLVKKYYQNKNA